jgi:protein-L-isoaspartate(D-aspartate) O-methyltransferase
MIAIMLEALSCAPEHRALEVGAGSGYAAALLAELCAEVSAIELRPRLAELARQNLAQAGVEHVTVHVGDGCRGRPTEAPFDRILVSAGAASVPAALLDQLAPGGRIVIPVNAGDRGQLLRTGTRVELASMKWQISVPCTFVPLVERH